MKRVHKAAAYVGSTIVTLLLIPEILTVIKHKSAKGLSYLFLSLHFIMPIFFIILYIPSLSMSFSQASSLQKWFLKQQSIAIQY